MKYKSVRHITCIDTVSSSDYDTTDHSDNEETLVKKHTKKFTIVTSSDSDEKPCDSPELYARTKHTAHTVQSPASCHSDDDQTSSNNSSTPSHFLDCEAEEVWQQSDEGCGSDDMQDFIVDDAEEWDASEVDSNKMDAAHSVSLKHCHGRRILDSSSESEEDINGMCDL